MARKIAAAEAAHLFRLLGDPSRLRLLMRLRAGEACVKDLCAATGQPQPAVSRNLGLLRLAGVVEGRRQGRQVFYRLASPLVAGLLRDIREG